MARDRGGPKIAVQFPIMAALDDRMTSPSANAITDEPMANHDIPSVSGMSTSDLCDRAP